MKLRETTLLGGLWPKVRSSTSHFKVLLPSFLNREPSGGAPKRVNKTAWLDGLRGIAAFIVFIYHFQYAHHIGWKIGYGGGNGKNDHYIGQLPIIRCFFNGGPMVNIFWVISGAALSLRPLQLARSQSYEKLMVSLFSSVFRRCMRLYLPCIAVSFCIMILVCLGTYDDKITRDWPYAGSNERQPAKFPTIGAQLWDWIKNIWRWTNPFSPSRHYYDPHYWTIPQEFRYSIILFATQAGSARLKPKARTIIIGLLYIYCMCINQAPFALFLGGMLIAEFILELEEKKPEFITENEQAAHSERWTNRFAQQTRRIRRYVPTWPMWFSLFLFSLHLIGFPQYRPWRAYGYATIHWLTPGFVDVEYGFYWALGSTLCVFALAGAPFLQRLFSNPLSVYLGHISFALYIVHGPVNHIIGYRLVPFMWGITGKEWVWRYELGLFLSWLILATIVIWLADLVTRVIDQPMVKFARWVQQKCEVKLQATVNSNQ